MVEFKITPSEQRDNDVFGTILKGLLDIHEMEITFTKKDGTERVMRCTKKLDLLPKKESKSEQLNEEETKERKVAKDLVVVYDLESEAWRSFRAGQVTDVKVLA